MSALNSNEFDGVTPEIRRDMNLDPAGTERARNLRDDARSDLHQGFSNRPSIASHPNATTANAISPGEWDHAAGPIRPEHHTILTQAEGERNLEHWRSPAQRTCLVLGTIFVVLGGLGFAAPGLLGHHLSPIHNFIHLGSGALAIGFGLARDWRTARTFCLGFGAFYALLGLTGFLFGTPGLPTVPDHSAEPLLLTILPGSLELGTSDHWLHLIVGSLFLATAAFMRVPRGVHESLRSEREFGGSYSTQARSQPYDEGKEL